jgi:regulator of protease activity HflC (stomatin/prohibitin superfamily)
MSQDIGELFPLKRVLLIAALVVGLIAAIVLYRGCVGKNDIQTYQIWQGISGQTAQIDTPGYYFNNFGTAWTYPKSIQCYWSVDKREGTPEDESVRVTFNDAGTAQVSTMVQFSMPMEYEKRLYLHTTFGGNIENIKHAVHAHLVNCIKNTGPLMSASENQASRKAEFTQVIEEQMRKGLYLMRRTTVQLKDRMDDKGNPISVEATEIVRDEKGNPIISERSPLNFYGLEIVQFSITGTEYDQRTIEQFAAKQNAFLAAERSKAEREQEIQKKLMIEAQGLRQVAEIEAAANQAKAKAVTEGQQRVEVAMKEKQAAETFADQKAKIATIEAQQRVDVATKEKQAAEMAASQRLSVAEIEKKAAETKANQEAAVAKIAAEQQLRVAEFEAQAAAKKAEGILALAQAKAKEIDIAGAVKEHDRVLAEIARDRDIRVAEALSKIQVPSTIIQGGASQGGEKSNSQNITEMMLNLTLLKSMGLVKEPFKNEQPQAAPQK